MSDHNIYAQVFLSANGWRYRIVSPNGEIVAQSEAYASKANAKRGARVIDPEIPIIEVDS